MRKFRPTSLTCDRGYGLIEVVAAMALVAGAYFGVVEAYLHLRLHYGQIEAERVRLNNAQDQHERGSS